MKRLFIGCVVFLLLTSCSYRTCYQVYSVVPENADLTENGSPVFVTEDGLRFTYNFWGECGNMRFIAYNTNDYDVIVDMTRSSFIRNNIAEDYYQGKQLEERRISSVASLSQSGQSLYHSANASKWDNYLGYSFADILTLGVSEGSTKLSGSYTKVGFESAIVYTEPKEVRIPAHSAKIFNTFNINNYRLPEIGSAPNDVYAPKVYTKQSTPMVMRNRICVYREGGEPLYHNMDFYISGVGNVESLGILVSPVTFYISYSTNEKSIKTKNMSNQSSNQVRNLKEGDEILYDGIKCYVLSIDDISVTLIATDETKRTWDEAVYYCKLLGDEWVLPSKSMIHAISSNVNNIVQSVRYWTNKSIDDTKAEAYSIRDNVVKVAPKTSEYYTIAITTLNLDKLMQR